MLRLKINGANSRNYYINLNTQELLVDNDRLIVTSANHGLMENDSVRAIRYNYTYDINESYDVEIIDRNHFSIPYISPYVVDYYEAKFVKYKTGFDNEFNVYERNALEITFTTPHNFIYDKNFGEIKAFITDDYYNYPPNSDSKKCVGDYVWYNGLVYEIGEGGISDNGYYIFSNNPIMSSNNKKVTLYYTDDATGEEVSITDGLVMVTEGLSEDRYHVYFFYPPTERKSVVASGITFFSLRETSPIYQKYIPIVANSPFMELRAVDDRFFIVDNNTNIAEYYYNTSGEQISFIQKVEGDYRITIPFEEIFNTSLLKEESVTKGLVEEVIENSIPEIIDYEKKTFEPVFYDGNFGEDINDNEFSQVNDIYFNLHLRQRETTNDEVWVTNDELGWNNYVIETTDEGSHLKPKDDLTDSDADLLVYANYNDDDVYTQKKSLKKTFIRLLFFDTPDTRTQTLQFYSTIFIDSGDLYNKYILAKSEYSEYFGITDEDTYYVSDEHKENKDLRLSLQFHTSDRYDIMHSSEGFYLYLYPSLLNGTKPTELYMRVELNHARYGRTVLFTQPSYEDSGQTLPTASSSYDFPLCYMMADEDGYFIGPDYERLVGDTYIKVLIKRDSTNDRYLWFLPRNRQDYESNGDMVLNLFEPRINAYYENYESVKSDAFFDDTDEETGEKYSLTVVFFYSNEIKTDPITTTYDNIEDENQNISLRVLAPKNLNISVARYKLKMDGVDVESGVIYKGLTDSVVIEDLKTNILNTNVPIEIIVDNVSRVNGLKSTVSLHNIVKSGDTYSIKATKKKTSAAFSEGEEYNFKFTLTNQEKDLFVTKDEEEKKYYLGLSLIVEEKQSQQDTPSEGEVVPSDGGHGTIPSGGHEHSQDEIGDDIGGNQGNENGDIGSQDTVVNENQGNGNNNDNIGREIALRYF